MSKKKEHQALTPKPAKEIKLNSEITEIMGTLELRELKKLYLDLVVADPTFLEMDRALQFYKLLSKEPNNTPTFFHFLIFYLTLKLHSPVDPLDLDQ